MNSDFFGGKSGSAKIEGHSRFEQILDLKPYLTEDMQSKHSKMFCRLFAVIVHAGKNSHSGHYISYVRNIAKNEWWKMDDARISVVSVSEVMNAEAYMLFYRVVEHPFAVQLRQLEHELQQQQQQQQQEWSKEVVVPEELAVSTSKTPLTTTTTTVTSEKDVPKDMPESSLRTDVPSIKAEDIASVATSSIMSRTTTTTTNYNNTNTNNHNTNNSNNNSRKRKAPEFTCGEDWARAKTTLPEHIMSKFREIENMISEYVQFKPEFFKFLADQASRRNAKVGHGPSSGICGK